MSSQQQNQLVAGQLSEDSFLYVWTPSHVAKLNRRNKITSPQLQLPDDVVVVVTSSSSSSSTVASGDDSQKQQQQHQQQKSENNNNNKEIKVSSFVESAKIVLLRGVVKAENEGDDPIGVFVQLQFRKNEKNEQEQQQQQNHENVVRCKLSVSCTPVRPGGHSHNAGPEEFTFTPTDNFKGMKALLPAAALKPKQKQENENETDEQKNNDNNNNQSPSSKEDKDELRFEQTSPVEIHVKIQFLKTTVQQQQQSSSSSKTKDKANEMLKEASSLFSGFTSQASTTLGSWWSAAATTGKEKVLPSMKNAFSSASEKVETLAHKIMKDERREEEIEQPATGNAHTTNNQNSANNNNNATNPHSSHHTGAPWNDFPILIPSTSQENPFFSSDSPENVRKWRTLITERIVDEQDSTFLWAPESVLLSTSARQSALRLPHRYPFFTFSPEEELALSQLGLSANQLLHCLDNFNFDTDVDESFISSKDPYTQHLRKMRLDLVPRLVSEEKFWASYLWRVKCLSFCKNGAQEAIVKTLISKPVEPLPVSTTSRSSSRASSSNDGNKNRRTTSTNNTNNQSDENNNNNDDNDDHDEDNSHHKQLLHDASEAHSLLQEVVEEEDFDSGLYVASLRGVERSRNNLEESINALNEVLVAKPDAVPSLRELWKSQWRELSDMKKKLDDLIVLSEESKNKKKETPEKNPVVEEENNDDNKSDDDEDDLEQQVKEKQKQREQEESVARLNKIEEETIASPQPEKPQEKEEEKQNENNQDQEDEKKSPTATTSVSKSRTPVLMPWEEEEDE